jgi:excisionase family DNA binding protein
MPSSAGKIEILTIRELAQYLKVNERTIYRLVSVKKIPAFKVGGSWRFRQSDVDTWIEENQTDRPLVESGKAGV